MSDILDDWISEKEFAADLGVSERTPKRWREKRIGPKHSQAGKKLIIYHKDDVRAWLEAGGLSALRRARGGGVPRRARR